MSVRELLRCRSYQDFIRKSVDELGAGQNTILFVPRRIDPSDVSLSITYELEERGVQVDEASLASGFLADSDPLGGLSECFRLHDRATTITEFIASDRINQVVVLHSPEPSSLEKWLRFTEDWSKVTKAFLDKGNEPKSLCVVAVTDKFYQLSEVNLQVKYLWGIPSVLETRLICRSQQQANLGFRGSYIEFVLPSLVGNDLELADHLGEAWITQSPEELAKSLAEFGELRGWDDTVSGVLDDGRLSQLGSTEPPGWAVPAWTESILLYSREYGLEFHPAASGILKRVDDIRRRLWRGEMECMLPRLNSLREELCAYLDQEYGEAWVRLCDCGDGRDVDRSSIEWGFLDHLWRHHLDQETPWLSVVSRARKVRNSLSHYDPVGYQACSAVVEGRKSLLDESTQLTLP